MRVFLAATLLGVGMLATVAKSHAQSISIGRNGVYISPANSSYVPYQSCYGIPSNQDQYATPYYPQYSYPSASYWNGGWNGGWNHGGHYHSPRYHQGYWRQGHYHPGHWHSGQWYRGNR